MRSDTSDIPLKLFSTFELALDSYLLSVDSKIQICRAFRACLFGLMSRISGEWSEMRMGRLRINALGIGPSILLYTTPYQFFHKLN